MNRSENKEDLTDDGFVPYIDFEKVENKGVKQVLYPKNSKNAGQVKRYGEVTVYWRCYLGNTDAQGRLNLFVWALTSTQVQQWMRQYKLAGYGNFEKHVEFKQPFAGNLAEILSVIEPVSETNDRIADLEAKLKAREEELSAQVEPAREGRSQPRTRRNSRNAEESDSEGSPSI